MLKKSHTTNDSYRTQILEVAQSAVNYRKWLAALTYPYLGPNPLEFGSGIGDYAKEWLLLGLKNLTVSENSPTRISTLRTVFADNPCVLTKEMNIETFGNTSEKYSAIVSLNVIEHLENDHAAMLESRRLLESGGYIVAFTPAFPLLMSKFDKAVGHYRRYTKHTACELLRSAGFDIVSVKYVNSIGWFAWLIGMKILKIAPSDGPLLKAYDRVVIPMVRAYESWITPPFGQSILIIGRVPLS